MLWEFDFKIEPDWLRDQPLLGGFLDKVFSYSEDFLGVAEQGNVPVWIGVHLDGG